MSPNRIIYRRCVSCRAVLDRENLFKITNDSKFGLSIGTGTGRSAYICKVDTCLLNAEKKKRLQKSLRCKVEQSIFEKLKNQLKSCKESIPKAI